MEALLIVWKVWCFFCGATTLSILIITLSLISPILIIAGIQIIKNHFEYLKNLLRN